MLSKRVFLAVGLVSLGLLGVASPAEGEQLDPLTKRGKSLWISRGCDGCHGVGKLRAGPDLAGIEQRRSKEWIVNWLKNTTQMLASDSTAMALLEEWHGMRMPQQRLNDQEIDAILAYVRALEARL